MKEGEIRIVQEHKNNAKNKKEKNLSAQDLTW